MKIAEFPQDLQCDSGEKILRKCAVCRAVPCRPACMKLYCAPSRAVCAVCLYRPAYICSCYNALVSSGNALRVFRKSGRFSNFALYISEKIAVISPVMLCLGWQVRGQSDTASDTEVERRAKRHGAIGRGKQL